MSVTTPPRAGNPTAIAAAALAKKIVDRLTGIESVLNEQLRLSQSSVQNFIGAGTVTGGGTAGAVPVAIVNGNPRRRGLHVQNLSAGGNLTVGLGTTQPQPGTGIVLPPGQSWDGRVSGALWKGSISVVGVTAGVLYAWLDA
jgi:hypothetical protein